MGGSAPQKHWGAGVPAEQHQGLSHGDLPGGRTHLLELAAMSGQKQHRPQGNYLDSLLLGPCKSTGSRGNYKGRDQEGPASVNQNVPLNQSLMLDQVSFHVCVQQG